MKEIKEYINSLVEENICFQEELARRAEIIINLKEIIDEARAINQECIQNQSTINQKQEKVKKEKV